MMVTEAGASVTGCIRSDAPKTRCTSTCIRSVRLIGQLRGLCACDRWRCNRHNHDENK